MTLIIGWTEHEQPLKDLILGLATKAKIPIIGFRAIRHQFPTMYNYRIYLCHSSEVCWTQEHSIELVQEKFS